MLQSRRLMLRLAVFALLLSPAALRADEAPKAVTPAPRPELKWWMPRHEQKLAEAKKNADKIEVVFIGDSITHGWEGSGKKTWNEYFGKYHALNLGYGGDKTEHVIWRLQHGEVDGLTHAKVAVLMIGTNNAGRDPAADTAAGIKKIVEELRTRLPQAKVVILAIFPRGAKPADRLRVRNEEVNKIIAGYADNQHVFFQNINDVFLEKDGTLTKEMMPDLLHPHEKGYGLWAKAVEPTLEKLTKN